MHTFASPLNHADHQDDLRELKNANSYTKRAGLIVRIGEKRALHLARPLLVSTADSGDNDTADSRSAKRIRLM